LAQTRWNCKYHNKRDIGNILREIYERKGMQIIEPYTCTDDVHMYVSIPQKTKRKQLCGLPKGGGKRFNIVRTPCEFNIQIWAKTF